MGSIKDIVIEVQDLLDRGTQPDIIAELLCINKQMVYDIEKDYKPVKTENKRMTDKDYVNLFYDLGIRM